MSNFQLEKMIDGKEKYFSESRFVNKVKDIGLKLGMKALYAASLLFFALKSSDMSKANKLLIVGVLGYFILPMDLVVDFLPVIGLSDDIFVIMTALSRVYGSITDDMREEAHQFLKNKFGDRYDYESLELEESE